METILSFEDYNVAIESINLKDGLTNLKNAALDIVNRILNTLREWKTKIISNFTKPVFIEKKTVDDLTTLQNATFDIIEDLSAIEKDFMKGQNSDSATMQRLDDTAEEVDTIVEDINNVLNNDEVINGDTNTDPTSKPKFKLVQFPIELLKKGIGLLGNLATLFGDLVQKFFNKHKLQEANSQDTTTKAKEIGLIVKIFTKIINIPGSIIKGLTTAYSKKYTVAK